MSNYTANAQVTELQKEIERLRKSKRLIEVRLKELQGKLDKQLAAPKH
jgi:chaperonin cofactor prefoldin